MAIGDIHGDAENFLRILRIADLIEKYEGQAADVLNNPPKWKFSQAPNASVSVRTTLVQLGDLVDRGEQDLEALNIAIGLQEQTRDQPMSNDKVVLLLGNHELLNIQGYYHYVNKNNYGGFISRPLRAEAMDTEGIFGKYIIDNFKTAHVEENTLFVHAGIEHDMTILGVDSLNSQVRDALRRRDFRHIYLRSNGPLWTRKMISDSMVDDCADTKSMLDNFNALRVVVGHTPQRAGQVEQYCDGRVIAADVGISRWMYNKVAALEMVFLRYVDAATQRPTTKFLIRELTEKTPKYALADKWQEEAAALSTKLPSAATDDDDGDL